MDLQVSGVKGEVEGASQGPGPGEGPCHNGGGTLHWVRGSRWLHFMVQITDKSGVWSCPGHLVDTPQSQVPDSASGQARDTEKSGVLWASITSSGKQGSH